MLHLLQMGPFEVITTLFSIFRILSSSQFRDALPVASLLLLKILHQPTLSLRLRTPPACIPPLLNRAHLAPSANAALPPHPRFQTSYPPFAHFVSSPSAPSLTPHASGCFSTSPSTSSSLTPSGFFNRMLGVSEPEALTFCTLFRLIPLSFAFRNLTLIYLSLSGSLDFLLCDLIAPTPGLVFFC